MTAPTATVSGVVSPFVSSLVAAETVYAAATAVTSTVRLPSNVELKKLAVVTTVSFWPRSGLESIDKGEAS
jgi:hypothetical protein